MIEIAGSSPAMTMKLSRAVVALAMVPTRQLGHRRAAHPVERVLEALRGQTAGRHIALRDAGETAVVIGRQATRTAAAIDAHAHWIVNLGLRRRRGESDRGGHAGQRHKGDTITLG